VSCLVASVVLQLEIVSVCFELWLMSCAKPMSPGLPRLRYAPIGHLINGEGG
jgi:hypothetical protein